MRGGGGWGERGKLLSWNPVIVNFWCPWIMMYRKAVLWIIVIEFYVLHETLTANLIVYTVHVHWGQIEEIKSLIWLNNLNHHLEAWFNFTFEVFYVTSHFSVLRPKHVADWDQIHYLFCDSWNAKVLFLNLWRGHLCPTWYCTYLPRTVEYVELAKAATCASRISEFLQTVGVKIILYNNALWTYRAQAILCTMRKSVITIL